MFRSASAFAVMLLFSASVLAQKPQPATATTPSPPPAAKARFATPVKGEATVQVISGQSKYVGKEIVTTYKIKNMAKGPIAMLRIDEYWYDKSGKLVSTAEERYRQPFLPGEVIELTARAPATAGALNKRALLSHANGKVVVKAVKQFD